MAFQTGVEGKAWYLGLAVGVVVMGILYFAVHQWKFKEMQGQIQSQDARLGELQAQVNKGRIAKRQLPEFRAEVRRLETELDKLLAILPARRNTPDLLRRIRTLTEQGDFEIRRIRPGNFVDKDFYSEWPINISLRGTYHNLAQFFDRISRFSRIINVEQLKIDGLQGGGPRGHTIGTTFTAKTFVYQEPEAVEDEGAAGAAR